MAYRVTVMLMVGLTGFTFLELVIASLPSPSQQVNMTDIAREQTFNVQIETEHNRTTASLLPTSERPPLRHHVRHRLPTAAAPDNGTRSGRTSLKNKPHAKTKTKLVKTKLKAKNKLQRLSKTMNEPHKDEYDPVDTIDDDNKDGGDDEEEEADEEYWTDQAQNDFLSSGTGSRYLTNTRTKKKGDRRSQHNWDGENFSYEYRIKRVILRDYDKTSRPVRVDNTTTTLFVGMSLYHILDTNEKFQTLSALIAIRLRWMDEYLTWDPKEYGGVKEVWLPSFRIWTPDIFINNFADDSFQDFMNTFAIVSYDGHVLWMFPAVSKTYCTLDVRHFPFDHQRCKIVFISWTFNGYKLDVTYNASEDNIVYYKPRNQEWRVERVTVNRHVKTYACCVEPYPDVTFVIHMTRRSLFYIMNLIFPCLLIYAVSFLGFFLPVESGEKVNLEITILLALVVFLLIVGETLPPTPDAIPVLGVLFGTTMVMVSISLVMAVIVTNIYLRKDSGKAVPAWVRRILLRRRKPRRSSVNEVRRRRVFARSSAHENHTSDGKLGSLRDHTDIELDNVSAAASELESLAPGSGGNGIMSRRCTTRRSSVYNRPSTTDMERNANFETAQEWDNLAQVIDRLFFWIFFVASAVALTTMFAPIPNLS